MILRHGLLLAPAFLLAHPVAAQQQATPQENLDCAIWVALTASKVDDPVKRGTLNAVLGWFVGQYEGQTGSQVDEALADRAKSLTRDDLARLQPICVGRAKGFGERLGAFGKAMQ